MSARDQLSRASCGQAAAPLVSLWFPLCCDTNGLSREPSLLRGAMSSPGHSRTSLQPCRGSEEGLDHTLGEPAGTEENIQNPEDEIAELLETQDLYLWDHL